MNAYELAKAQQAYSPPTLEEIIKQQADRIEELEQNLSAYIVELELHKAMIQDLERKLNNV